MKLSYAEGSVFLIPLRKGGFGRGVVARSAPRGKVLLGYFFGPRLEAKARATLDGLGPEFAVARARFGDLGLINGDWPVIGKVANWDRTSWPMPDFVRREPISGKAWLVRYSDADPRRETSEQRPNHCDLR